jgi:hypothetical protein
MMVVLAENEIVWNTRRLAAVYRRCSTGTSMSQGRSVPFFLSASFLSFFMPVSLNRES